MKTKRFKKSHFNNHLKPSPLKFKLVRFFLSLHQPIKVTVPVHTVAIVVITGPTTNSLGGQYCFARCRL